MASNSVGLNWSLHTGPPRGWNQDTSQVMFSSGGSVRESCLPASTQVAGKILLATLELRNPFSGWLLGSLSWLLEADCRFQSRVPLSTQKLTHSTHLAHFLLGPSNKHYYLIRPGPPRVNSPLISLQSTGLDFNYIRKIPSLYDILSDRNI